MRIGGFAAVSLGLCILSLPGVDELRALQITEGQMPTAENDSLPPLVGHGPGGFFIRSPDDRWRVAFQFRLQFRLSHPWNSDPVTRDDYLSEAETSLSVNRARLKVGGHGYRPWLNYYFEYELASSKLLNFEVTLEKYEQVRLRVGQWKAQYSRERIISSGRQQLVDRSLINRYFTLDRQQGMSLWGRLGAGSAADFSYWLSAFNGMGRGADANDDGHLMYMGRVQWNALGRVVPFAGSDLATTQRPAFALALGGATNRSSCTRFSTAGCGSLGGFEDGAPGQFRVNQAIGESAFLWRGLSWAHESHWKRIDDLGDGSQTTMAGHYAQLGYFFGEMWEWVPPSLEVAFRYAVFRPDVDESKNRHDEFTTAVNWFFQGHNNKLTADLSWLRLQDNVTSQEDGVRFRLQWDIQF